MWMPMDTWNACPVWSIKYWKFHMSIFKTLQVFILHLFKWFSFTFSMFINMNANVMLSDIYANIYLNEKPNGCHESFMLMQMHLPLIWWRKSIFHIYAFNSNNWFMFSLSCLDLEVDTWQPKHVLEWGLISRNLVKNP